MIVKRLAFSTLTAQEQIMNSLHIVNGSVGPNVFSKVASQIESVIVTLLTYLELSGVVSVRVMRPFARLGMMGENSPVSMRPTSDESLPLLIVYTRSGQSAFECSVKGVGLKKLQLAVDELNSNRGKPKKASKPDKAASLPPVEEEVVKITAEVPPEKTPDQLIATQQEVDSPERAKVLHELEVLQLGSCLPELEDFFAELWTVHCNDQVEGEVFLTNHVITSVMKKYFEIGSVCLTAQMYSVRISHFGKQVNYGKSSADRKRNGWNLDMKKVLALVEHKAGIPKKSRDVTILLPGTETSAELPVLPSGAYPELHDGNRETSPEGVMKIVLTGEEVGNRIGDATGLETSLIADALRLLSEHETHKVNALHLNGLLAEHIEERDQVLAEIARLQSLAESQQTTIEVVRVRHEEAVSMVEVTRIPEAMLAKLRTMQEQLQSLMAYIASQ